MSWQLTSYSELWESKESLPRLGPQRSFKVLFLLIVTEIIDMDNVSGFSNPFVQSDFSVKNV